MLEQISLSISTAIFLVCTVIANSFFPKAPEQAVPASVTTSVASESNSVVGKWNSNGRVFEFTDSGKLIFDGKSSKYSIVGDTIVIETEIAGENRKYELPLSFISDKVASIGGVRMYRVG